MLELSWLESHEDDTFACSTKFVAELEQVDSLTVKEKVIKLESSYHSVCFFTVSQVYAGHNK